MKTTLLNLLFLGLSALLSVQADSPATDKKIFLDCIQNGDNPKVPVTVTEWFISPQTLEKLAAYDPAAGDLPLSVKDAVKAARADLMKHVKAPEKWRLDSVEMYEIDAGRSGDTIPEGWSDKRTGKWYFKVVFSKPVESQDIATKTYDAPFWAFVLMDGTLAETCTRPQTKEEAASDKDAFEALTKGTKEDKK